MVRLKLTNRVIHSCCNETAKSVELMNDKNIKVCTNILIKTADNTWAVPYINT